MELDRQTIERRDFPIGRRGYEPEAVDAHLESISAEVEALRRSARSRSGETLASAASTQVQAIVQAAETSAADIERQAELEAKRIRQDAEHDAQRAREEAVTRAEQHVSGVSAAAGTMLQRVDAMESELTALFESLRTGANRLTADLSLLEGNMGELYGASGGPDPSAGDSARSPQKAQLGTAARVPEPVEAEPDLEDQIDEHDKNPSPAHSATGRADRAGATDDAAGPGASVASPGAADAGDVEGARLIALNMALNGQSREEADRYLAENFDLSDRAALLDEVYAAVEG